MKFQPTKITTAFLLLFNKAPSNDPSGHPKMLNEISTAVKAVVTFPAYNLY
jgi:hypothetical protein